MDQLHPAVGSIPRETLSSVAGLDILRAVIAGRLPQPPISRTLRFALTEAEPGFAAFAGTPDHSQYNPLGVVHGGWAGIILDSVMACAVHTMLPAGTGYTTLEFKVNLVRAVTAETGPVRAEGHTVNVGRRVATAEGRLVDANGRLLAHGTETCLVFDMAGTS